MNWLLLKNSLLVGGLTTLLAASFGFLAALWLAGLEGRWRNRLLAVAVMALALPPFVVTNCWLHFLGYTGVWRGWLPLNIVSLGGTVWILSLLTWPITLFMVLSAWQRLEPSQLESDVAVSGWWLIRGLLWPLGRTALAQAAVLTFVLALNNFAVPAILQVKVFPAEMWVRFNTTFDTRRRAPVELAAGGGAAAPAAMVRPARIPLAANRRPGISQSSSASNSAPAGSGLAAPAPSCSVCSRSASRLPTGFRQADLDRAARGAGCGPRRHLELVLPRRRLGHSWSSRWAGRRSARAWILANSEFGLLSAFGFRLSDFCRWLAWLPFLLPGVLLGIGLIVLFNRPWFALLYQSAGDCHSGVCDSLPGVGLERRWPTPSRRWTAI